MRTEHDLKLMQHAQGALLGEVAPSFRAVPFRLSKDGRDLTVRFIFDGEPSEDAKEVANVALTNLLANYSQNHRCYKEEMLAVPYPEKNGSFAFVGIFGQRGRLELMVKIVLKHLTSKGSIALRAGRANARRCFGR